jgi:hypothetical protein
MFQHTQVNKCNVVNMSDGQKPYHRISIDTGKTFSKLNFSDKMHQIK